MYAELKREDWVGASSWGIDMSLSKEEFIAMKSDINDKLNYTSIPDDLIYRGNIKSYVSYYENETTTDNEGNTVDVEDTSLIDLLGYENTPEFYGVLPLIKI